MDADMSSPVPLELHVVNDWSTGRRKPEVETPKVKSKHKLHTTPTASK